MTVTDEEKEQTILHDKQRAADANIPVEELATSHESHEAEARKGMEENFRNRDFQILSAENLEELSSQISKHVKEGFMPAGTIFKENGKFYQSMLHIGM